MRATAQRGHIADSPRTYAARSSRSSTAEYDADSLMLHDDNPLTANARVMVGARVKVGTRATMGAAYGVIRTTTLPNCSPNVRRAYASRPASRGNTESTGGNKRPARNSLAVAANSASLPIVDPISVH